MMEANLWRSPAILCTGRGTVLWTNTQSPQPYAPDLRLLHPGAVQEKNFGTWIKIATNDAEESVPYHHM